MNTDLRTRESSQVKGQVGMSARLVAKISGIVVVSAAVVAASCGGGGAATTVVPAAGAVGVGGGGCGRWFW